MNAPTVLWRLFRSGEGDPRKESARHRAPQYARAVLLPGGPPHTLSFFVNDAMDRAENYETMELALFRADDVKRSLKEDGWREE